MMISLRNRRKINAVSDSGKAKVAQSIAKVLGADEIKDGYMEGNGSIVSWCVGHLVELAQSGCLF